MPMPLILIMAITYVWRSLIRLRVHAVTAPSPLQKRQG
jgi:hypothetical protein